MSQSDLVPELGVLMLGGKGSGKTCFMLGMYNEMRTGKAGFTFSTKDPKLDTRLSKSWGLLRSGKGKDRYPMTSDASERFAFHLNYALQRYMEFTWIDYPGGSLVGNETNEIKAELQAFLGEAFGVLMCVPADRLLRQVQQDDIFAQDGSPAIVQPEDYSYEEIPLHEIWDMLDHLQRRMELDLRPPIVIATTRLDLFLAMVDRADRCLYEAGWTDLIRKFFPDRSPGDFGSKTYKFLLLESLVREYLNPLFLPGNWDVAIAPVTLGISLAGGRGHEPDHGPLAAMNMHLPMLYLFKKYIDHVEAGYLARASRALHDLSAHDKRNVIYQWINSDDRIRASERVRYAQEWAQKLRERRENVERAIPPEMARFEKGKRIAGL